MSLGFETFQVLDQGIVVDVEGGTKGSDAALAVFARSCLPHPKSKCLGVRLLLRMLCKHADVRFPKASDN